MILQEEEGRSSKSIKCSKRGKKWKLFFGGKKEKKIKMSKKICRQLPEKKVFFFLRTSAV